MVLTVGENEYFLSTQFTLDPLAITDVVNVGLAVPRPSLPLERVSVPAMIEMRRSGSSIATGSGYYRYAMNGSDLFMIYPTPSQADMLEFYYVPTPSEMSSASHDPKDPTYGGIPVDLHPLIETWACYKIAMYDDDASSAQGQMYKQAFDQGVAEARRDIAYRGGRKLGPARLGRRVRVNRDPSATGFFS